MDEARFCFPREQRLHKRREYLGVYAQGEKFHTPHFVLYILENEGPCHRLGITVSRKIGNAVSRNQIKRRLREIFRKSQSRIPSHCDFVVNVKRAAAGASFGLLSCDFAGAVRRWQKGRG